MDSGEIKVGGRTQRTSAPEPGATPEAASTPPPARAEAAQGEYAPRYEKPARLPAEERAAAFNPLAWLADGLTGALEEARHNDFGLSQEFWTHFYAVRREGLLTAQALVESLLAQVEGKPAHNEQDKQRRARRGDVDIDF